MIGVNRCKLGLARVWRVSVPANLGWGARTTRFAGTLALQCFSFFVPASATGMLFGIVEDWMFISLLL